MNDYAKHIEVLEDIACEQDTKPEIAALTAAIELMRAAAPESPKEEREYTFKFIPTTDEAERAHCAEAARRGGILAEEYMRERAAARAEGYAQRKAEEESK